MESIETESDCLLWFLQIVHNNEYEDFNIGKECLMEPTIKKPTSTFIMDFISRVKSVTSEEEQALPRKRELSESLGKMLEKAATGTSKKFLDKLAPKARNSWASSLTLRF